MSHIPKNQSSPGGLPGWPILSAYFLTLALMFGASFLTDYRWWGLSWWGYFPLWLRVVVFAVAALLPWMLPRWLPGGEETPRNGEGVRLVGAVGVLVFSGICFVLLRTQMHLLGDGFQLLSRLAHDAPPIRPWNPAVYFLQDNIYALLGADGETDALLTFRLISWVAGLLFAGGLVWTVGHMYTAIGDRVSAIMTVALSGQALVFFGYVENYPMFVALIGLFVMFGWSATSGRLSPWWALAPLVVAALFHPFTATMVPAMLYLAIRDRAPLRWYDRLTRAQRLGLWAAVVSPVVLALFWLMKDVTFLRFALVPWINDRFTVEGYTLLSVKHLGDFANLLFMLAPALLIYLAALKRNGAATAAERDGRRFLMLAALPALAVAFLFDPKLGMARDWDIFAFGAVPVGLLGVTALLGTNRSRNLASPALAAILALLLLAPRVVVQMSEERAVAMLLDLAELDQTKNRGGLFVLLRHYQETGRTEEFTRLQEVFAARYPQDTLSITGQKLFAAGKIDEAEAAFRETVRLDPTYASAWANLGVIMGRRGQPDSAEMFLRIADGLNPYNPDTYNNLGGTYHELGRYDDAERMWKKSWALNKDTFIPVRFLMRLYAREQRRDEYVALMIEAATLPKAPAGLVKELADYLAAVGKYPEATMQYRRALDLGLDTSAIRNAQQKHPELKILP